MSPERWQQIEPILDEALALSASERSAYLQQACEGDDSLRAEVESFLFAKSRASDFLEQPVFALPSDIKRAGITTQPNTNSSIAAAPLVGQHLGKYKILSLLGKGGMGEVYLARDTRLDTEVAIKLLPPNLAADPERAQRFRREAQLQAKLNYHPHIATIHALEQSDEASFFVLEYVPGETLADRLHRGPLTVAEALPLFRQIADALATAHEQGIIHRDLKPANIKITPNGQVKVLDFGLAKLLHHDAPTAEPVNELLTTRTYWTTGRQIIIGTVPYMSPEQTYGKDLDHRTDLWAFGCVLYESLTGKRPFDGGDTFDIFNAIRTQEPDWSLVPAATPPAVRQLLQQCLHRETGQRLASARAAVEIIAAAVPAPPLGVTALLKRWIRQRKKISALIFATSLLLPLGELYRQPLQAWITAKLERNTNSLTTLSKDKTLVVLPFKEAGSTQEDKVGRGFAKALQEILASAGELRVLPLAEALQANISNVTPDRVSKVTGATFVLDGEIRREKDALSIEYWVQNSLGTRLTSGTVTGKTNEYARLQAEITERVVRVLNIQATALQVAATFKKPDSEERYLEALNVLQTDLTKDVIPSLLKNLQSLQQAEPNSAPVLVALAQAHFRRAKEYKDADVATSAINEALKYAEQAVALAPTSMEAELVRGQSFLLLGQPDDAIHSFTRARQQQPSSLDAILGLAYAHQDARQPVEAEKYYREAVSHWPDYWGSYNELGAFLLDQGQFDLALATMRKVIELNPTGVTGYINAGNACIKLERYAEAEDYFRASLNLPARKAENTEEAYIGWGVARYYQRLFGLAAESFRSGLQFNDKSILLLVNLGDALRQLNSQDQEALTSYQKAIELLQRQELGPQGLLDLAELFAKRSRLQATSNTADKKRALQLLRRAVPANETDATLLGRAALIYHLLADDKNTFAYLEKAVQQGYRLTNLAHDPDYQGIRLDPRFDTISKAAQKTS